MNQRPANANLDACDALHLGVGPADQPFGSDGDHRLLHGIKQAGQLLVAALDLGKALTQPFGALVQRGLYAGEFVSAGKTKAGAQVARANLPRKGNHSLKPRAGASVSPGRHRQHQGQRYQAGP